MMKSVIIGGIAGAIIVIFVVLIALDVSAAQQLQLMAVENEEFDFMSLSMDSTYAVCNPSSFPTSFDRIYAQLYYKSNEVADFTVWGTDIPAGQARDTSGRININGQTVLQMFLGAFAGAFTGQSPEFNQDDVEVYLKIEKSILGFIPYSVEKRGGVAEIQQMLGTLQSDNWDCNHSPKMQQLSEQSENEFVDSMKSQFEDTSELEQEVADTIKSKPSEQEIEAQKGHIDAVILVKIFGDRFDFSLPAYQLKSSAIYFSGDGHTIHTYPSSTVDIPYLFDTLGMELTSDCLVFREGREFCSNNNYQLEFYLNGVEVDSLDNIPLANNDKILILYGSDQSLNKEMSELSALRPIHRYQ